MISEEYLASLKKARKDFMNHTGHPEKLIRKDIYDSWIRSRSYEINPEQAKNRILSPKELSEYIRQNQILYDITSSFMEYLYQFVRESGFIILFAEKNGYILKSIGDSDITEIAKNQDIPLIEGSCRSESVLGTNAIGTPLATGKPIQLFSYEHYFELGSNWTCSGAPITLNGEILGVICISGPWNKVHTHTLGMAMSAAEAISRQLYLTETNHHLTAIRNQLQTTIDSIHSGIFLLDEDYRVSFVNAVTLNTLQFSPEEMLSHSYREFFPNLELEKLDKNTYDIETTICGKQESFQCYISIKFAKSSSYSNRESFSITFRKNEYIQNLVNKVIGSDARYTFDSIIGECPAMTRVKNLAKKVAPGNTNVLITGESGTGKELFAQAIHNSSFCANGPFVAINCGAIPKDLIESELFGYEAGAFTGAKKEGRAGKFELANNGTIFLDEIGDMPFDVQVRLLRVLQERTVTRIGGKKSIPLNVRVIAATNRNLADEIENHTFRSDLFYRLNVFSLQIPPLRERGSDVFLLVDYFLQKYQNPDYEPITCIEENVKDIFEQYTWPGNIRELENVIERVCILTTDGVFRQEALPGSIINQLTAPSISDSSPEIFHFKKEESVIHDKVLTAEENEKKLILEHLALASGNIKKASDSLGISRRTLYRKLEKYQIDPNRIRYENSK